LAGKFFDTFNADFQTAHAVDIICVCMTASAIPDFFPSFMPFYLFSSPLSV